MYFCSLCLQYVDDDRFLYSDSIFLIEPLVCVCGGACACGGVGISRWVGM